MTTDSGTPDTTLTTLHVLNRSYVSTKPAISGVKMCSNFWMEKIGEIYKKGKNVCEESKN